MNNCYNATEILNTTVAGETEWIFKLQYVIFPLSWILSACYLYTLYIIASNAQELGNHAYYACLGWMGVFDLAMLVKVGIVDLIVIFNPVSTETNKVLWMIHIFIYFVQLGVTSVITTNRATSVLFWTNYEQIFDVHKTKIYNAVVVVFGVALATPHVVPGVGYTTSVICGQKIYILGKKLILLRKIIQGVLINSNVVTYLFLYLYIRRGRKNANIENKSDKNILIQSFFIVCFHFLIWVVLCVWHYIIPGSWGTTAVAFISLINAGMNPFLYIRFSTNFRSAVQRNISAMVKSCTVTHNSVAPLSL